MESADALEIVVALVSVSASLAMLLYGTVKGLRYSFNIIRTRQFRHPRTGQLIVGKSAARTGVIGIIIAGVGLAFTLGMILYLVYGIVVP
jgi:predicted Kef-type K+ transport protein